MNELIDFIKNEQLGDFKENVSFKTLTTYKTGGNARIVVFPKSVSALTSLLDYLKEHGITYKIFGNGSNILVSDKDYDGVIIRLKALNNLEIADTIVTVGAGYLLNVLANKVSNMGLSGLEFACGIPGTIGGAIYMNAGAYLASIGDVLEEVTILDEDETIKKLKKEDLNLGYRKTNLQNTGKICLEAKLKLVHKPLENILELTTSRKERRLKSQPLNYPSAGSVFRNPEGDFAGRLIEECGLKGKVHGGAMISDLHANFIINLGNATSSDIKYLMELAQSEVKKKFGINLIREQELFNWE